MNFKNFVAGLKNRRIAFIGVGISHTDAIRSFAKNGADILVLDKKEIPSALREEFEKLGVEVRTGEDYLEKLDADIYFRTPGLPFGSEVVNKLRANNKVVTSELEVFFELCAGKIIGVTGSDGKTTTTTLIYEILKRAGKRVYIGGNIGLPLLAKVDEITCGDFVVVELSSFQLESIRVSPEIAVVTNISENHLNVHGTVENYVAAKKNIVLHQNEFSKTVLSASDCYTPEFARLVRGQLILFGNGRNSNVFVEDGKIWANGEMILELGDIKLRGAHNVQNFMAAIAVTGGLATAADIKEVATSFLGVEHRIEFCGKMNRAACFNDSIATTPIRTMAALASFEEPIVLIAGGSDKGLCFAELGSAIAKRVKCLLVTGETGPKIKEAAEKSQFFCVFEADGIEAAVKIARKHLQEGDVLLFSPASASFDKYKNFEERGRHFKQVIAQLGDGGS
ncbi:MAG: UDP-N-acetylmuramoyl-L-alanine--D-glutamate ligase [Oscillospiraceae bacterium]|jgi:UDP-N-acetylmuramoylalanine--D-glutamate ligase|nr:UDP-N-acetylmuramoyl-L-alanine--D-glutamate ligase [Oscillospiraceae bacterium]